MILCSSDIYGAEIADLDIVFKCGFNMGSLSCQTLGLCVKVLLMTTACHWGNSDVLKSECLWIMNCLFCVKTKVYKTRPFVDCLHMNREISGHDRCITVLWALGGSIISTLTDITDSWHWEERDGGWNRGGGDRAESVPAITLWLFSIVLITATVFSLGNPLETQVP